MAEFEGFDDLARQLRLLQHQLNQGKLLVDHALDSAVETTAQQIESQTKKNLTEQGAVDTGNLRASYGYAQVDTAHYKVGTPVDYAPPVEFGSEPHVITADDGYLRFEGQDGEIIYRKSVNHPGTEAQPHFRPALRDAESLLVRNIREEINKLFREVFG